MIIGGEPLLYRDLCPYLEYLGNRYGSRIANIQLITNGSIAGKDTIRRKRNTFEASHWRTGAGVYEFMQILPWI